MAASLLWRATATAHGRPLPAWRGCRTLRRGDIFLLNPSAPDSFDGRYFGALPASALLGRATPILTRDAPDKPLRWRVPITRPDNPTPSTKETGYADEHPRTH